MSRMAPGITGFLALTKNTTEPAGRFDGIFAANLYSTRTGAAAGQLSFESMLADICQFMALASKENALKYFAYWSAMIGLRQAPAA